MTLPNLEGVDAHAEQLQLMRELLSHVDLPRIIAAHSRALRASSSFQQHTEQQTAAAGAAPAAAAAASAAAAAAAAAAAPAAATTVAATAHAHEHKSTAAAAAAAAQLSAAARTAARLRRQHHLPEAPVARGALPHLDFFVASLVGLYETLGRDLEAIKHEEAAYLESRKALLNKGKLWQQDDHHHGPGGGSGNPAAGGGGSAGSADASLGGGGGAAACGGYGGHGGHGGVAAMDVVSPRAKFSAKKAKRKFSESLNRLCQASIENKRSKLPPSTTELLTTWFLEHQTNPYPTKAEKQRLGRLTGLDATQIRNWFTNIRKRHWAPVRRGREPRSFIDFVIKDATVDDADNAAAAAAAPPPFTGGHGAGAGAAGAADGGGAATAAATAAAAAAVRVAASAPAMPCSAASNRRSSRLSSADPPSAAAAAMQPVAVAAASCPSTAWAEGAQQRDHVQVAGPAAGLLKLQLSTPPPGSCRGARAPPPSPSGYA